jgi:hypothetical protein
MSQERKRVDQADTSRRDGPLRLHDPSRTFAQNVVSYIRHKEAYVEGRSVPTGMMLLGTAPHPAGFRVVAGAVLSLFRFEQSTTEKLFASMPPEADRLYCVPMMTMPKTDAEAKRDIEEFLKNNDVGQALYYLHVNGWWVSRPTAAIDGSVAVGCTPIKHIEPDQPGAEGTVSQGPRHR